MYPVLNEKLVPNPHVDTAIFVRKIPKNQGFLVKNATNALVNTIELYQLFEKIKFYYLFMPFSLLDHNCPRYVCA